MSDETGYEPLYDPQTGEHTGWSVIADDGALIGLTLNGLIVGAVDPMTGEELDATTYTLTDGDDGSYDPQLAELQAQVSELEERLAQAPAYDPAAIREQAHEHATDDAWRARVQRDMENVEAALGRQLSDRETWQILNDHHADHLAGEPNVWKSAAGADIADTSTHEGRVQRAMDSLQDAERAQTGEQYHPDNGEWHEPASSHPSDVRLARAMNYHDFGVPSAQQAIDEADEYSEEDG